MGESGKDAVEIAGFLESLARHFSLILFSLSLLHLRTAYVRIRIKMKSHAYVFFLRLKYAAN